MNLVTVSALRQGALLQPDRRGMIGMISKIATNERTAVRIVMRLLYLLFVILLIANCQSRPHNLPSASVGLPPPPMSKPEYRLQPGDIIESHFGLDPTLDQQTLVAPDGRVAFRYLPNVMAAGLTLAQLRAHLIEHAGIVDSLFTISLRSSVGTRVYVLGEVPTPGEIIENGQISALQALSRAGGFKLTHQIGQVVLLRRDDENKPHLYGIDINRALDGSAPHEDIMLQAYDILYVPRDSFGSASLILERIRNAVPFNYSFGSTTTNF